MIRIRDIYKMYISDIYLQIKVFKDRKRKFEKNRDTISIYIEKYLDILPKNFKCNYKNIDYLLSVRLDEINVKISNNEIISKTLLSGYIKSYIVCNRIIKHCDRKIKELSEYFIPFTTFKTLIYNYNNEVCYSIINGYKGFSFGHGTGVIEIKRKERNLSNSEYVKPKVNYYETNKYKAELLASGKSLYNKENNPHGMKYLIFHTNNYNNWWYWSKLRCNIANKQFYNFHTTHYNHTGMNKDECLKTIKSKEEFKNLNIGANDKLNWITSYDSTHYLNFL